MKKMYSIYPSLSRPPLLLSPDYPAHKGDKKEVDHTALCGDIKEIAHNTAWGALGSGRWNS